MLFVASTLKPVCGLEWENMSLCLPMLCVLYILTSLSPLPKTLQHILFNFQCILTVNHHILEFLAPERTLKFQEITDFRNCLILIRIIFFVHSIKCVCIHIQKKCMHFTVCGSREREREREIF